MKVSELIKKLQELDGNREVIVAHDSEGNEYTPLCSLDNNALFVPYSSYGWLGDVFIEHLTPELVALGYSEEDVYHGSDGKKSVILYPL